MTRTATKQDTSRKKGKCKSISRQTASTSKSGCRLSTTGSRKPGKRTKSKRLTASESRILGHILHEASTSFPCDFRSLTEISRLSKGLREQLLSSFK